jgi:hypothetical protein
MKRLASGVLAAALLATTVSPASAQTNTAPQTSPVPLQNAPGTGGTSKPGMQGLAGSKSGPAVRESSGSSDKTTTKQQDESKVPGLSGGESGPAVKRPTSPALSTTPQEPSPPK